MRIGILCSGGDSPGMNTCIESIVRKGIYEGHSVYGIYQGFEGLYKEKIELLTLDKVNQISRHGGTILGSSRFPELKDSKVQNEIVKIINKNIDYLIVIGGNGSFNACKAFLKLGIKVISIPATIDNDIPFTQSIGFDTALNTAIESIEKIEDSAKSHKRSFIIEVMGNKSGNIAYNTLLSGVGNIAIIQEYKIDIEPFLKKEHNIIILSEGAKNINSFSEMLSDKYGHKCKIVTLGHIQRGGSPSARDRLIASTLGLESIKYILEGKVGFISFWKDRVTISKELRKSRSKIKKIEYLDLLKIRNRGI